MTKLTLGITKINQIASLLDTHEASKYLYSFLQAITSSTTPSLLVQAYNLATTKTIIESNMQHKYVSGTKQYKPKGNLGQINFFVEDDDGNKEYFLSLIDNQMFDIFLMEHENELDPKFVDELVKIIESFLNDY